MRSLVVKKKTSIFKSKDIIIFKPNDNFKSKWDMVIIILAIFNCFTIPMKTAFEPPGMNSVLFTVINSIVDLVFLLDIIITFRTAYIDDYGNEISTPKDIAITYLKGVFWVDLLATLPLDQILKIFVADKNNPIYESFGVLKLIRVLRLNKIIAFLNIDQEIKIHMKLFKLIFFLFLYLHIFACIWFLVVDND